MVTRAGWLLVAVLSATGCATIDATALTFPAATPCIADPAVVGTWTDARLTQLGPAWVRLTLTCDCRYEWRGQLLFGRITKRGAYRAADQVLHFPRDPDLPYTVEDGRLELTEFPGEHHVYSRLGTRRTCGTSTVPQARVPRLRRSSGWAEGHGGAPRASP